MANSPMMIEAPVGGGRGHGRRRPACQQLAAGAVQSACAQRATGGRPKCSAAASVQRSLGGSNGRAQLGDADRLELSPQILLDPPRQPPPARAFPPVVAASPRCWRSRPRLLPTPAGRRMPVRELRRAGEKPHLQEPPGLDLQSGAVLDGQDRDGNDVAPGFPEKRRRCGMEIVRERDAQDLAARGCVKWSSSRSATATTSFACTGMPCVRAMPLAHHDPERHRTAGRGAGDRRAGRPEDGAVWAARSVHTVDAAAEPAFGQLADHVLVPARGVADHGVEIVEVRVQDDACGKQRSGWRAPSALRERPSSYLWPWQYSDCRWDHTSTQSRLDAPGSASVPARAPGAGRTPARRCSPVGPVRGTRA